MSDLVTTVKAEMKAAMKAQDPPRLAALRQIRASLLNELKKDNSDDLADPVAVEVLRRLEKQRKESIQAFEKGGRDDRAADEKAELAVIQEFLPSLADEATTRAWVPLRKALMAASSAGSRWSAGAPSFSM